MQIMVDTATDSPKQLRLLAQFLDDYAAAHSAPVESPINESNDKAPIVLHAEPDFKPEESLPADAFERDEKSPPPLIPPPPTVFIAPAPLSADVLPFIPPAPGPQPAPELDSAGVAYDANLHSSTKSKTIDGKWKARRNRGGSQVPADTTSRLSIQGVKVPPGTEAEAIAAYVAGKAPLIPPPTGAPLIPPPPAAIVPQPDDDAELEADEVPAAPAMDFPTFITKITAGMNAATITQARITEVMAQFKLDSLFSLNTKPELVGDVAKAFGFV
jgi:hypothetical protein